jgi:hypothetical protein
MAIQQLAPLLSRGFAIGSKMNSRWNETLSIASWPSPTGLKNRCYPLLFLLSFFDQ